LIKFTVLGSGSTGNAVYVEVDDKALLLDAGLNFKQLNLRLEAMNRSIEGVEHIFISHQHGDHVRALGMIEKKIYPMPVVHSELDGTIKEDSNVDLYPDNDDFDTTVTAFRLDHDDPCLGYVVKDNDGNKLLYITDTGSIPCDSMGHMLDCGAIIVEANHDVEMLNNCLYLVDRQERVFQTHMENYQAMELLEVIKSDKLRYVVLHHLSQGNNDKALAEYEAKAGLGDEYSHVKVLCADAKYPTPTMVLV